MYKKIATIFAVASMSMAAMAQNPICPIGTYIADPTARVWDDGKLYIYGSSDESTQYYCSYRHDVMYSSDMRQWGFEHEVFSSRGENDAIPESDALLFAPDIMYANGKYFLYFCSPNKQYSEGVAESTSPLGPFINAQKLNTAQYNQIDPTIFIDDDNQAYYYWGQATLKGAKMGDDMTTIDTASICNNLIDKQTHFFHEGSFVFKRNGIYYVLYAHEGRRDRRPTALGYATATSPLGPFTYQGVVIDNFGCDPESWNNHGSIAEFGGQWYVFYHRSSHASKMMRRACAEPIFFNEDGTIDEVEMTCGGAAGALDATVRMEAERASMLSGYCRVELIGEDNEAVCRIRTGDVVAYRYLDFGAGVTKFTVKVDSQMGGVINLRTGDAMGRIVGRLNIDPKTKGKEYGCTVEGLKGVEALYLECLGAEKGTNLFSIDSFIFE